MATHKLIVVGDSAETREVLEVLGPKYDIVHTHGADETLDALSREAADVLIAGTRIPGVHRATLLDDVRDLGGAPVLIAVAGYENTENIGALRDRGVYDYIEPPFTVDKIDYTVEKAFEYATLRRENQRLHSRLRESDRVTSLVGNSLALQKVREKLRLVASSDATVLITGESGTGKEIAAREIHRMSNRGPRPFVKVSCASMPEALLETELFGAGESAAGQAGRLETADGGTVLLDEISDMSAAVQAKLLALIQEGVFHRVGSTKPLRVDVRIIATTNRNLKTAVEEGRFREDLFYRLNVVPVEMPPLRERKEDVPLLIQHFIEAFSRDGGRPPIQVTDGALRKLRCAYWRGNVRELENLIERAVILASGATLDENYFHFDDDNEERLSNVEQTFRHGSIRDMEKLMILQRLVENEQNRTRAAKTLDISVRTLRNKLREYREAGVPVESRLPGHIPQ